MKAILLVVMLALAVAAGQSQERFSVNEYYKFISEHKNMSSGDLMELYPAGLFERYNQTDFKSAGNFGLLNSKLNYSNAELNLLTNYGFAVTERFRFNNFFSGMAFVYNNDLPYYFSSDAMLHAFHVSFDKILANIEEDNLYGYLVNAVSGIYGKVPYYAGKSKDSVYLSAINDMDIYSTIAYSLAVNMPTAPNIAGNQSAVDDIRKSISWEQAGTLNLFGECRLYDFSQFTVRGHYNVDPSQGSLLSRYFKAMMWLGRTELKLNSENETGKEYIIHQRQAIVSALIAQSLKDSGTLNYLDSLETALVALLAPQDNISIREVISALDKCSIKDASELADTAKFNTFRAELMKLKSANQLYNSQILFSDPYDTTQVKTPTAFLLVGQRPILDGFITANVVYDKVIYQNAKVRRMLPKTQDIMFAFGNDASAQLLQPELDQFNYSSNIAALRYLVDGYDSTFWHNSTYNGWLNAIRSLNPPKDRSGLPAFMQTAAWWQKTMTTQLASWAELRHDFLLYAKQPYSAGIICSFPDAYAEPVPDFYQAMADLCKSLQGVPIINRDNYLKGFFQNFIDVSEKLKAIAERELRNEPLDSVQIKFLKTSLSSSASCGGPSILDYSGWYLGLYYGCIFQDKGYKEKYLVADYHTAPTDENANMVGWVCHAGTGPVNLATIIVKTSDGCLQSYAGPVYSYYEYTSTNFKRLTDEYWDSNVVAIGTRPSFSKLYLADSMGGAYFNYTILRTKPVGVEERPAESITEARAYPNPFSGSTCFSYSIGGAGALVKTEITITDMSGNNIAQLLSNYLPEGNYATQWDGRDSKGNKVPAGMYICRIQTGAAAVSCKVEVVR